MKNLSSEVLLYVVQLLIFILAVDDEIDQLGDNSRDIIGWFIIGLGLSTLVI